MTVYLLHFSSPLGEPGNPRGQAQHYIGSTSNLKQRMAEHSAGDGAAIMRACKERGIDFTLARTWPGGRQEERQLKNRHKARQLCPICEALGRPESGANSADHTNTHADTETARCARPSVSGCEVTPCE
jgi:predicted GIY-YIG superfamily endonuclease